MEIKQYDPIIAILYAKLSGNAELKGVLGEWATGCPAIYPQYIDAVTNPVYPSITICRNRGSTLPNRTGYAKQRYYIHGWSKAGPDEVAYMLNLVTDILDIHPIYGERIPELASCRKADDSCPLYDKETQTYYFMSDWLIQSKKALMYAE